MELLGEGGSARVVEEWRRSETKKRNEGRNRRGALIGGG